MKRFEIHRAGKIQPRDNLQPLGLIVCSLFFEKFTLILDASSRPEVVEGYCDFSPEERIVSVDEQTRVCFISFVKRKVHQLCEPLDYLVSCRIIYCGVFIVFVNFEFKVKNSWHSFSKFGR